MSWSTYVVEGETEDGEPILYSSREPDYGPHHIPSSSCWCEPEHEYEEDVLTLVHHSLN